MRLARIKDGYVVNVEVWDDVPTDEEHEFIDVEETSCAPGWTYIDGAFIPPPEPVIDPNVAIKAALEEIDKKSIRSMREWLIKQPDCPQYLKDYDAQASEERKKLVR